MDKYNVKILSRAYNNLDEIYYYIKTKLYAEQAASDLIKALEESILSLELIPYKGSKRKKVHIQTKIMGSYL